MTIDTQTVVERTAQAVALDHIKQLTAFDGVDISDVLYEEAEAAERWDISKALEASYDTSEVQAVRERLEQIVTAIRAGLPTLADNDNLRAQVADLADKLHKAQHEIASLTKAGTAWANEVAAKDRVIEAVESLLRVTDGDPLGDRGIAIPLGEIRRVVAEARAEVAR